MRSDGVAIDGNDKRAGAYGPAAQIIFDPLTDESTFHDMCMPEIVVVYCLQAISACASGIMIPAGYRASNK